MLWKPVLSANKRQVFVDLAREAVALQPDLPSIQESLGRLLLATGGCDEAIQVLSKAITTFPSEPGLFLMLADAYYRKRQPSLAWSILLQTPRVPVNDRKLTINRLTLILQTLESLEGFDDAANVAADLLKIDPANQYALECSVRFSRKKGNPEIVLHLLQEALNHQPGHTTAYYELALTYALLGRSDEARAMIDLNRFIKVIDLGTPPGYQDAVAFETAVAGEIASDVTLKPDPPGQATESGFHTDFFLPHNDEQVSVCDVISMIRSQLACFVANLTGPPDTPFIKRKPKQGMLNAWAVVHPCNGRQRSHIHPDGWLSGVYYVSAPRRSPQSISAGCLVLGAVDEELNLDPPWGIREISPVPGRLVLFPSYIPHATVATGSPHTRICVAFDVMPCP
jgi:Flp pilus assembly protein TadD